MTEQLVLYPEDIQENLETIGRLPDLVHGAGLTGTETLDKSLASLETGTAFTRLVSFLGCSPTIKNSGDGARTSIQFVYHKSGARFLGGKNTTLPSCSRCKTRFPDWPGLVQQWQKDNDKMIICPECKIEKKIPELNWHYRAGFSNYEIIINEISEGTALPASSLLEILKQHTQCKWHYFYRRL
jgi:hypothetical protein